MQLKLKGNDFDRCMGAIVQRTIALSTEYSFKTKREKPYSNLDLLSFCSFSMWFLTIFRMQGWVRIVGDPPSISSCIVIDANFVLEWSQFCHLRLDAGDVVGVAFGGGGGQFEGKERKTQSWGCRNRIKKGTRGLT